MFKDTGGKWLTLALFWEERHPKYEPSFTLKDYDIERDGKQLPSLKHIYLSFEDPTEYSFATEVLGGWEHWQALCDSYKLKPYIAKWRDELEIKLRSTAIRAMVNSAKVDGSKGLSAAKYLAEKGWEKKRGRPSKDEVEKERKIAAGVSKEIADDLARMGIH